MLIFFILLIFGNLKLEEDEKTKDETDTSFDHLPSPGRMYPNEVSIISELQSGPHREHDSSIDGTDE